MPLHALEVRDFRCFQRLEIQFHIRANIIIGLNGSGKTSIVEAIHLLSSLRSLRSPSIRDLIRTHSEAFSLRGTVGNVHHEVIHVAYGSHEKVIEINGVPQQSRRALQDAFRTISVTADDMKLVQGFPEVRRNFIDALGVHCYPSYQEILLRSHHLHKQRTALFTRGGRITPADLALWTEQMWQASAHLRAARQEVMQKLTAALNVLCHQVDASLPEIQLIYHLNNYEQQVASADDWISRYYEQEVRMRRSLLGAQSDDIDIMVAAQGARRFASRGMQKLLMIMLKLAQIPLMGESTLLLDDLLADFDEERLALMFQIMQHAAGQIILTTPRQPDKVVQEFIAQYQGKIMTL